MEYPTKLDRNALSQKDWVKLRTLELYDYLPQTTLKERASYIDIRDELIELNDNFFWYLAKTKYINNPTVTVEDKYQSAVCHFINHDLWAKYRFDPDPILYPNEKHYRTDLAFSSFFKPRLTECMAREFVVVRWALRQKLCTKAANQLNKYWADLTYEDLNKVTLPPQEMAVLQSIFCTMNNANIDDVSLYKPAASVTIDTTEELFSDDYDSIEDLIIHEMLEKEQKLEDSYLLKMSGLYGIPYNELLAARPAAEEKLRRQLEDTISVQSVFDYSNEYFAECDD